MYAYFRKLMTSETPFTLDIKLHNGLAYEDRAARDADAMGLVLIPNDDGPDELAVLIPWSAIAVVHVLEV